MTLECNTGGLRLDVFLTQNLPGIARNTIQRLLQGGCVSLRSGEVLKKSHKTTAGEVYIIAGDDRFNALLSGKPLISKASARDIKLDIVYEDSDLIAVNKPRGMVVHPAPGHYDDTLVNALLFHCGGSLSGIGGVLRPGIVHRIDKETSGLIIAAKNDEAHRSLARQLSSRTLTREYEAVVCGNVKLDTGTIDLPIGRHPADRKKQAAFPHTSPGSPPASVRIRSAVTHYRVLTRYTGYTHICCRLETGRTHQIRVHMANIHHPILGDTVYGRKKPELGQSSQCLHAGKLSFIHPVSGEQITLHAGLPDYFIEVLHKLEKLR